MNKTHASLVIKNILEEVLQLRFITGCFEIYFLETCADLHPFIPLKISLS